MRVVLINPPHSNPTGPTLGLAVLSSFIKVNFQDMKKKMEEYNAQLQTILTEEQYAAYKSDREKMMRRGPRQGRNQHNNNDNK